MGRRLWLGLGVIFHGVLILFMNIGMFPFIMLMTYVAFFEAEPFLRVLRGFARLLPKSWEVLTGPAESDEAAHTRPGFALWEPRLLAGEHLVAVARTMGNGPRARLDRAGREKAGVGDASFRALAFGPWRSA